MFKFRQPALMKKTTKNTHSNAKFMMNFCWISIPIFFSAVRVDRMRRGRNKLGCYYKCDRLKASADSDDGHGKENGDAEMENAEG
jgi:hypothetical protein